MFAILGHVRADSRSSYGAKGIGRMKSKTRYLRVMERAYGSVGNVASGPDVLEPKKTHSWMACAGRELEELISQNLTHKISSTRLVGTGVVLQPF